MYIGFYLVLSVAEDALSRSSFLDSLSTIDVVTKRVLFANCWLIQFLVDGLEHPIS